MLKFVLFIDTTRAHLFYETSAIGCHTFVVSFVLWFFGCSFVCFLVSLLFL